MTNHKLQYCPCDVTTAAGDDDDDDAEFFSSSEFGGSPSRPPFTEGCKCTELVNPPELQRNGDAYASGIDADGEQKAEGLRNTFSSKSSIRQSNPPNHTLP